MSIGTVFVQVCFRVDISRTEVNMKIRYFRVAVRACAVEIHIGCKPGKLIELASRYFLKSP